MEKESEKLLVQRGLLGDDIAELRACMDSEAFGCFGKVEQRLMHKQVVLMQQYSEVLAERLWRGMNLGELAEYASVWLGGGVAERPLGELLDALQRAYNRKKDLQTNYLQTN